MGGWVGGDGGGGDGGVRVMNCENSLALQWRGVGGGGLDSHPTLRMQQIVRIFCELLFNNMRRR